MDILGQVIGGSFDKVLVRQKSGGSLELGELVAIRGKEGTMLCQVYDLLYGSQLSGQHLELMAGMRLEQSSELELFDEPLRNYLIAALKTLITINGKEAKLAKSMPAFFSPVEPVQERDLAFLVKPKTPLRLGLLRSGSKRMPIDVYIDATLALSHHILIAAQTGKGKSNLTKCLLWNNLEHPAAGILVLDPHDEYFGRSGLGLKDHQGASVSYYTTRSPPPGARSLRIPIRHLTPRHFQGAYPWSDAQMEALSLAHRLYGEEWIERLLLGAPLANFMEGTLNVIKRRLMWLLDLDERNGKLYASGPFDLNAPAATIGAIIADLEQMKVVIIDTSTFSGATETLIGTLLATEILQRYQSYNVTGQLERMPVIAIVLEEAARVLGRESLESGPNIFSTLAREGRKFKVGLVAITQLPSAIPRDVLANLSTKIVLGLEMSQERKAIIESAAQDLSTDDRTIASLDKGEALVSSTFTRFAMPIAVPLFKDIVHSQVKKESVSVPEFSR